MKFPNNLYLLRSNRGLQQKEVSDAIGIGQSEYSKMEQGDRKLGIHLDKLLKFFGVDQDTILSNVNVPSPHSIQHTSSKAVEDLPMYGLPFTNVVQGFQVQKKLVTHCARPDFLVEKDGVQYIAEIKTGEVANPTNRNTRRQLHEYSYYSGHDVVLLVDPIKKSIKRLSFQKVYK